jgi:F-type H+-transporting ATPase subunit b
MATETTYGTASACVDAGGSAIGMPQLCADWIPNQIFWLVITLIVIYFVLSRVALPRIAAVLAERAGTITNDLAAAENLKDKARAAEAAYEKALADARNEANRIIAVARAELQAELDVELAKADAQIAVRTAESERALAAMRDQALDSIGIVARDTAREIVAVLGGGADASVVDAAVAARMKG